MNLERKVVIERVAQHATSRALLSLEAVLLGAAIFSGVLLHWTVEWSPRRGISFVEGDVALCGGLLLVVMGVLYVRRSIGQLEFLTLSLALASSALGATVWFWLDIVGTQDPITKTMEFFQSPPPVAAGSGWYVTCVSSTAAISLDALALRVRWRQRSKMRRRTLKLNIRRRNVATVAGQR